MTDKELEIAIEAFWETPGSTFAGIRAAIDAVDRHRDGWSKTLSGRDERSGTEATQAVAVGVSGDFAAGRPNAGSRS